MNCSVVIRKNATIPCAMHIPRYNLTIQNGRFKPLWFTVCDGISTSFANEYTRGPSFCILKIIFLLGTETKNT